MTSSSEMADLVLLVLVPGLGDEIQALKAGVMEIGDIFVINKSDRDDAAKVRAEVEYVLHMKQAESNAVPNPVVMTSVLENTGIDELLDTTNEYINLISQNGFLQEKRKKRIAREIKLIITDKVRTHVQAQLNIDTHISDWVEAIVNKKVLPYKFINDKIKEIFSG